MGDTPRTATTTSAGQDVANGLETLGFEEALNRLGRAVESLEQGELGLDAALARYEEGVRLLGRCRTLLDGAERRVALLTGLTADGTPRTEPFDAQATADRAAPAERPAPARHAAPPPVKQPATSETWPVASDPDDDDDGAPF